MFAHGASRRRIAHVLGVAYADGLLSEQTFADRLDQLFRARLVEPARLIGELSTRGTVRWETPLRALLRRLQEQPRERFPLLALDWLGGQRELTVGRHPSCDVSDQELVID